MNKTDIYFGNLIKDKEKAVANENYSLLREINGNIKSKFVSLYVRKGYDMLIQDCASLLDVEEKWLIRNFGNEFDYVLVTSPSTKVFTADEVLNYPDLSEKLGYVEPTGLTGKELIKHQELWLEETKDIRVGLSRKRIFVHRESFYDFMRNNLRVINEFKRVVVPRSEVKNLPNTQLDKIKDEMLTLAIFNLGVLDERGKIKFHEQNELIKEGHFNKILKEKMYSGKSIKEQYISLNPDSSLVTKIYDTQLYRWLEQMDVAKITLKPAGNIMPVVRYLFPINLKQQLEEIRTNDEFYKKNYVFNVPSNRNVEEFIEHLIFYVDFLYSEEKINMDEGCSE